MPAEIRGVSCAMCPCGRVARGGNGVHCPFVDRPRGPGEYLYFQGDQAENIWFVKRGTIVFTRALGEEGEIESPRAVRSAGSFVGLEALVRPTYLDTARVISPATLCGARREAIDAWLGEPNTAARMALEQVLKTSCDDAPRSAGSDGNSVRRVARWLLSEERHSRARDVPRRYVAGLLGMVPETFSRALARLSEAGAIETTRKTLRVTDSEALREAAGL